VGEPLLIPNTLGTIQIIVRKSLLLLVFMLFRILVYSNDLKTIDSILTSEGYKTNIKNLQHENYYAAWKKFDNSRITVQVFGKESIFQIRVSASICPTLDSLSMRDFQKEKAQVKTRIINVLKRITADEVVLEKLEDLKINQPWKNSVEYYNEWLLPNSNKVLRYRYYTGLKCDIYGDGFGAFISVKNV
jgi:hypothetical protein